MFEGLLYIHERPRPIRRCSTNMTRCRSFTRDDMLSHCRQITKNVQDDFGAIGGVGFTFLKGEGSDSTPRGLSAWPMPL